VFEDHRLVAGDLSSVAQTLAIRHARRCAGGVGAVRPHERVVPRRISEEFHRGLSDHRLLGRLALSRATSHNAARFLEHVLDTMPFTVASIQVDGGSEFCAAVLSVEHAK